MEFSKPYVSSLITHIKNRHSKTSSNSNTSELIIPDVLFLLYSILQLLFFIYLILFFIKYYYNKTSIGLGILTFVCMLLLPMPFGFIFILILQLWFIKH